MRPTTRLALEASRTLSLGLVAGLLLLLACHPRARIPDAPSVPADAVALLIPPLDTEHTRTAMALWEALFPEATRVSAATLRSALPRVREEGRVLVVPEAEWVPVELWPRLERFCRNGGRLLFVGRNPFEGRVQRWKDEYRKETGILEALRQQAQPLEAVAGMQYWAHRNNSGKIRGAVRLADTETVPWPAVHVDVEALDYWDVVTSPPIASGAIENEKSFAFFAYGAEGTTRLVLECRTRDESLWVHTIPLHANWQPYVVHQRRFRPVAGPAAGMKNGSASLRYAEVQHIRIGLDNRRAPQRPGNHRFGLSNLRFLHDPRPASAVVEWPEGFLFTPQSRRYEVHATHMRPVLGDTDLVFTEAIVQSPLPAARGFGTPEARSLRWVPVYEITDVDGHPRAWPASIFIRPTPQRPSAIWGWVGVDMTKRTRRMVHELVAASVLRLRRGWFLLQSGCDRFTLKPGSPLRLPVTWLGTDRSPETVRLAAEMLDASGYVLRRVVTGPLEPPTSAADTGTVELDLGRAPDVQHPTREYTLRVSIEDAKGRGHVYDRIEQDVIVQPVPSPPGSEEWVQGTGARFTLRKRPFFVFGVQYAPFTLSAVMSEKGDAHWWDAALFDPHLLRRDLDRFTEAGFNTVALSYRDVAHAPQVAFVLNEARKRQLRVHLSVAHLDPLQFDPRAAQRLLDAIHLDRVPLVFEVEPTSPPGTVDGVERGKLAALWHDWILEQFGSVDHAEAVLGGPLWRDGDRLTIPPDGALARQGGSRPAIAVYRRFLGDIVSRRLGHVRQFLRRQRYRQLWSRTAEIDAPMNGQPRRSLPIEPGMGAVHLDYLSLSGRNVVGNEARVAEASFLSAYARGVSGGNPVVWMNLESPVGPHPHPAELEEQRRRVESLLDMALRSHAAGAWVSSLPLGPQGADTRGSGILHADGSWRPVGTAFRRFAHRLRNVRTSPPVWRGREIRGVASAGGLAALWDNWRKVYRKEFRKRKIEEVRPAGFGTLTVEILPAAVGGQPYVAPAPLQKLNAEWGRLYVDAGERVRAPGQPLRVPLKSELELELINTGAATWVSSSRFADRTVWVRAEHPERKAQFVKTGAVAFGDTIRIRWVASDPGRWVLRPYLWGVGAFGEALAVEVSGSMTGP